MNQADMCQDPVDPRKGHGNLVVGAMLILTGVTIMLDRTGVLHLRGQWTLWPLILGGIGLARFLQSRPGEPKQGLIFMTAALWLLLGESGVISLAASWPIIVIAFGLMVALNGGKRRRRWHPLQRPGLPLDREQFKGLGRPDYPMSGLAVLGIWIAVVVGLQVSGIRSFTQDGVSLSERVGVFSVMGRSEHISRAEAFEGADVTNVMGSSELDLTRATLAPGATATVHVFSAMGTVVVRVPPTWRVDTGAVSAIGAVRDRRTPLPEAEATADPSPRLVIRGLVMFGRLNISS